jgi:PTH1 family peptidyl-tRNA hydrolase
MDFAIVGLGNLGDKYQYTRHNIGWIFLDRYLGKFPQNEGNDLISYKNLYKYKILKIKGKEVIFVFPQTYMNESGKAVKQVCQNYNIKPNNVLLLLDEYNFDLGKFHLKNKSSDGGHNGTKSVLAELQSNEFYKLRLGIGKNFGSGELVEYVLGEFNAEEMKIIDELQDKFNKTLDVFITNSQERAMQIINSGKY